jgi:Restriction alleviation protein Lar
MTERQLDTVAGLEMFVNKIGAGTSGIDTAAELSSCPFCGHAAGYYESTHAGDKHPLGVVCTNTSCGVKTPQHYQSRELAAAAWNRRFHGQVGAAPNPEAK